MVVGAKVSELTDGFLWFVCGLYVGILTSPLTSPPCWEPHGAGAIKPEPTHTSMHRLTPCSTLRAASAQFM